MRRIDKLIIHCSGLQWGTLEGIRYYHMYQRRSPFRDIGYHYVIENGRASEDAEYIERNDGRVRTGRLYEEPGAHAFRHNQTSLGLCLVGKDVFTERQQHALLRSCWQIAGRFGIRKIIGHYEVNEGKTCPNMDMDALRAQLNRHRAGYFVGV